MTSYARRQRERERRVGSLPRDGEVVVPSNLRALLGVVLGLGLVMCCFALWLLFELGLQGWKIGLFVAVPGAFLVAISLRPALSSSPLVRADADGIELGHGSKLPWSAVRGIYPGPDGIDVVIDRGRKLRHMPLGMYVRSWLTPGGGVDLAVSRSGQTGYAIAARLEAMRVCALGVDENGRVAGDAELPSARVVES